MIAAYLTAIRHYAVFNGRAPRHVYWWFKLALAVLLLAALGMDDLLFMGSENSDAPLTGLIILAHVLPSLAVDVRRLHDLDRSGWCVFLGLIPLVGPVILVIWFCQPGTPGSNRFGPDPLDGAATLPPGSTLAGTPVRSVYPLATPVRDVVADIERLATLRASGSLSDAEFETVKAQVVAGGARA